MHINRSLRRLARMSGVEPPSIRSLEQRLEKSVFSIEGADGLRKRFNRLGVPPHPREVQLEKRFNRAYSPLELESGSSLKSEGKRSSLATESVAVANIPTTANSLGLDIEYVLPVESSLNLIYSPVFLEQTMLVISQLYKWARLLKISCSSWTQDRLIFG